MMAGNLSIEQRKWIVKQYWKTENAERVRTAWVEVFNTPPPTRLTIYRIKDKFDATGSVANALKSGRPRTSMTEENEMRVGMTYYTVYYILYNSFWPTLYVYIHCRPLNNGK